MKLNEFGVDDSKITDLLITHNHEDHINGFYFIAESKTKNGFSVDTNINTYLSWDYHETISKHIDSKSFCNLKPIDNLDFFKTGSYKITVLETNHFGDDKKKNCFGYLLENPEKREASFAD